MTFCLTGSYGENRWSLDSEKVEGNGKKREMGEWVYFKYSLFIIFIYLFIYFFLHLLAYKGG
jgi:hypothetical protein